jgi:hypothetical protein
MLQHVKLIHYSLHGAIIIISDALNWSRNTCCVYSAFARRSINSC